MDGTCRSPTDDEESDEPAQSDAAGTRLYRWSCPYCGKFGIQTATPEDVERYVLNSVRSHVRSSDGDGHGPRRRLPPGEDVESAIMEHVRVVTVDD